MDIHKPSHSSYLRYKTLTSSFVTWLATTAISCGFDAETESVTPRPLPSSKPSSSPSLHLSYSAQFDGNSETMVYHRPSGATLRTRVAMPSANEYIVALKQFVPMAECIKSAGNIQVPLHVLQGAREAIHLRQRCSDSYERMAVYDESLKGSNKTHLHFIGILRNTLGLLPQTASPSFSSKFENEKSSNPQQDTHETTNRFSHLTAEETFHQDLSERPRQRKKADKSQLKTASPVEFDIESSKEEDISMKIFCFVEETNELRQYITEIWAGDTYKSLDVMTASIITDLVLDTVRYRSQELHREYDGYEKFPHLMGYALGAKALDPDVEDLESTSEIAKHGEGLLKASIPVLKI